MRLFNFCGRRVALLAALLLLLPITAKGQYYSWGNDPGRVKWDYIESENFKVIFPRGFDSTAHNYSWYLEYFREPLHRSLEVKSAPIEVILHPYSAMVNGMVGWAPSRMELMTLPSPNDAYIHQWDRHLALHELRHVGQIHKFKRGIFKPLSWFIGEQSHALGVGLYMSQWSMEGDAVVTETRYTSGGRVRDPDHLIHFRAAFLNGQSRTYKRWHLGSYKHYIPGPYAFGSMFSTFLLYNSGNEYYLSRVTDHIVNRFYNPWAKNPAYRNETGMTRNENFSAMTTFYKEKWLEEESRRAPFDSLTPLIESKNRVSERGYHSYSSPVEVDGVLYALKESLDRSSHLVAVEGVADGAVEGGAEGVADGAVEGGAEGVADAAVAKGRERRVRAMGRLTSPMRGVGGRLYWSEYIAHPRWELESYSDIFYYDIEKGKVVRATRGEYLYNPHPSPDGEELLAVAYNSDGGSWLVRFNSETFEPIEKITPPRGYRVREALYTDDGIVGLFAGPGTTTIALLKGGDKLEESGGKSGNNWEELYNFGEKMVAQLQYHFGLKRLFFISDWEGSKDLYSLRWREAELRREVALRFGVGSYTFVGDGEGDGSCIGERVVLTDYNLGGYRLKVGSLGEGREVGVPFKDPLVTFLEEGRPFNADTLTPPAPTIEPKRYRKGLNLFKVHSWAPFYYDLEEIINFSATSPYQIIAPGVTLYSQNNLNTAHTMLGYSWNGSHHTGHLKMRYEGFMPIIEFSVDFNERERHAYTTLVGPNGIYQQSIDVVNSPYLNANLNLSLPLRRSSRGWSRGAVPALLIKYSNDSFYSNSNERSSHYSQATLGLSFYSFQNMAHRQLFPRWGGGGVLAYASSPFNGENFSSLFYGNLYSYLPGIGASHGLRISAAYQKQFAKGKTYLLSNRLLFPPGYENRISYEAYTLAAEYAMALYSGDITLTSALYIKRIQLNPFFLYTQNKRRPSELEHLYSYGADLLFDSNFLGISYPIAVGVKIGFTAENRTFANLLLKVPL